jgi:hypothetical protein
MKKAVACVRALAVIASSLMVIPSPSSAKTAKACEEEWKANKATIQANGAKKKDFITECRAGGTSTTAAPTTAPQPPAEERKSEAAPPPPSASTTSTAAGEFRTEAEAKAHCPGDTVVWANTRSKVYHYASSRKYGHTKSGAYMCEKETATAGMRAAKREKRS